MKQNNIIKRVIERYPYLSLRKVGFPYVGKSEEEIINALVLMNGIVSKMN